MATWHRSMAGIFALCVVLQWNDPDPLAWMAVYGAAAVLGVLAAEGRAPRAALGALMLVCAGWMVVLWPGVVEFARRGDLGLIAASMKAEQPWIEEAREFGGLLGVLAWCATACWRRGSAASGAAGPARPA